MVTPILTYEDIETLQAIIRLLRKAGAKSSPSRGCGVHIHIGKGSHTPRPCGIWSTSWQHMNSKSAERFASMQAEPDSIAEWSTPDSLTS